MWPNPQFSVDLVTFTEEILNEKLHFLCSGHVLHYQVSDCHSLYLRNNITMFVHSGRELTYDLVFGLYFLFIFFCYFCFNFFTFLFCLFCCCFDFVLILFSYCSWSFLDFSYSFLFHWFFFSFPFVLWIETKWKPRGRELP